MLKHALYQVLGSLLGAALALSNLALTISAFVKLVFKTYESHQHQKQLNLFQYQAEEKEKEAEISDKDWDEYDKIACEIHSKFLRQKYEECEKKIDQIKAEYEALSSKSDEKEKVNQEKLRKIEEVYAEFQSEQATVIKRLNTDTLATLKTTNPNHSMVIDKTPLQKAREKQNELIKESQELKQELKKKVNDFAFSLFLIPPVIGPILVISTLYIISVRNHSSS